MASLDLTFRSQVLGQEQELKILLPHPYLLQAGSELAVLYLLHGYSDNQTAWARRTGVERYLEDSGKPLLIVMPNMQNYFYTDIVNGPRFFSYIAEELPRVLSAYFHPSQSREHTFVAGLSMGGYGAFKLALRYPERFSRAASFSGALAMVSHREHAEGRTTQLSDDLRFIFGDRVREEDDLIALLQRVAPEHLPALYQSCGTADALYEENQVFLAAARQAKAPITYYEEAGIAHEWAFWDREIQKFIVGL